VLVFVGVVGVGFFFFGVVFFSFFLFFVLGCGVCSLWGCGFFIGFFGLLWGFVVFSLGFFFFFFLCGGFFVCGLLNNAPFPLTPQSAQLGFWSTPKHKHLARN